MDLNFYMFLGVWEVDASPEDTYAVLEALDGYPDWWPEVKEVRRIDDDTYALRCRSILPYDLEFESARAIQDPTTLVLEARLRGDLEGFTRWDIKPRGRGGANAVFTEEVILNKTLLRRLAPAARPAFKANHALMMYRGRRGLRTYLAGYRFGRSEASSAVRPRNT